MKIDFHCHSLFSHDGCEKIENILQQAKKKNIKKLAITDHCDWDYLEMAGYDFVRQIELEKYLSTMEKFQNKEKDIDLCIGIELGFHKEASKKYLKDIPFERLDYIINSVHSIGCHDVYFPAYFEGLSKKEAFTKYLLGIYDSLQVSYPYTTVAHIGYISKNAVYKNSIVEYNDFSDIIDMIFSDMIKKDKTLEINSNIKFDLSMPSKSLIKRYYLLGGRNIIFGSDAHTVNRLGEDYFIIANILKDMGFKYWTVYKKLQPEKILID